MCRSSREREEVTGGRERERERVDLPQILKLALYNIPEKRKQDFKVYSTKKRLALGELILREMRTNQMMSSTVSFASK